MEEELGIDPREVLAPLGDAWCLYNSPGEGGLAVTGLTAVVQVKDRQRLAAIHAKLLAMIKAATRQDAEAPPAAARGSSSFSSPGRRSVFSTPATTSSPWPLPGA